MKKQAGLEGLFDEVLGLQREGPKPVIIETKGKSDLTLEQEKKQVLDEIEQGLNRKVTSVLEGVVSTFELSDDDLYEFDEDQGRMVMRKEPPPWWKERYGDRAVEMFRAAAHGRMKRSDAPVAIDIAQKVHQSAVRARAMERSTNSPLNAVVVQMVGILPQYEVREAPSIDTEGEER